MFARPVVLRYASRYLPLLFLALLFIPLRIYLASQGPARPSHTLSTSAFFRPGPTLYSVAQLSPDNVWAVGGTFLDLCNPQHSTCVATPTSGTILHYSNKTWLVAGNAHEPLLSVALDSASDGWAVGYAGTFLHYNGTTWVQVPGPAQFNQSLFSIAMLSSSDGWCVGNSGSILHYDGQHWTAVPSPVPVDLRGIAMSSPQEGWAVGVNGTILHYLHGTWHSIASPSNATLNSITMLSPNEGWAVGDAGTILHYRAEDDSWTPVYRDPRIDPASNLYGISLNSVRAGWIVGQHQLLSYRSEVWTEMAHLPLTTATNIKDFSTSPPTFDTLNIYSIALSHSGVGWAVGSTDTSGASGIVILHYTHGTWSVSLMTS